jgi:hypothetical protein
MSKTIDNNFNLHACKIPGMTKGMIVTRLPGLTYVDSGLSCDTFNIIHITNGSLLTEQDCLQAVNYFRNKGLAFCIWISNENITPNVHDILNRASLKQQNKEPGMELDLSVYKPSQNALYDNIIIANTPQAVNDFAEVVACNWSPPDENIRKYFAMTTAAYADAANEVSLAIYYQDGMPFCAGDFSLGRRNRGFLCAGNLVKLSRHGNWLYVDEFCFENVKRKWLSNCCIAGVGRWNWNLPEIWFSSGDAILRVRLSASANESHVRNNGLTMRWTEVKTPRSGRDKR